MAVRTTIKGKMGVGIFFVVLFVLGSGSLSAQQAPDEDQEGVAVSTDSSDDVDNGDSVDKEQNEPETPEAEEVKPVAESAKPAVAQSVANSAAEQAESVSKPSAPEQKAAEEKKSEAAPTADIATPAVTPPEVSPAEVSPVAEPTPTPGAPTVPEQQAPEMPVAAQQEPEKPAQVTPSIALEEKALPAQTSQATAKPASKPAALPVISPVTPKVIRAQVTEEQAEPDIVGIDTVNLDEPQGNWLFKRIWWERAEKKIERIHRLVTAIGESQMVFLAQRTDIDRTILDPFYVSIGVGQGELQRILQELITRLEKEREKEGALSEQERDILEELRKEENALKLMKGDIEGVSRFDHDIDDALNTLFEQINKVRGYESEAWGHFKEIARVLDDTKARELYYMMDIIAKNIGEVQAYIQQDYTRHFNQLSVAIKQPIDRLKKAIETMKERGLDLGKKLELLEQEEAARASGKPLVPAQEEEEEEPEVEQGFFGRYVMTPLSYVGAGLKAVWDGVVYVVSWPVKYVMGGGSSQESQEEDED